MTEMIGLMNSITAMKKCVFTEYRHIAEMRSKEYAKTMVRNEIKL